MQRDVLAGLFLAEEAEKSIDGGGAFPILVVRGAELQARTGPEMVFVFFQRALAMPMCHFDMDREHVFIFRESGSGKGGWSGRRGGGRGRQGGQGEDGGQEYRQEWKKLFHGSNFGWWTGKNPAGMGTLAFRRYVAKVGGGGMRESPFNQTKLNFEFF